ncbi:nuclease-related domain-containing protein [Niallia sp. 03133]|uniref:nuclease-related domain-containing protein n=1 Tax=Niallia sp. 03133 TaxID=3458060 RepID=UPI004045069A
MYYKEVCKNERILKTEALINRLVKNHPVSPKVVEDLKKLLAGYKGEKNLKYYLDFFPEKECYIFHNLRLWNGKSYFQIDYLVLSFSFALIIECKNIYGELHFDTTFHQLIRTANDQSEAFADPISQVKRQQQQFLQFLKANNLPFIPVECLVVISSPSTIIKGNDAIKHHVIHSHQLFERWKNLSSYHKKVAIDVKMLRKIAKILLKNDAPEDLNILKKYGLVESDIITGVQCEQCKNFGMNRIDGKWICSHCCNSSRDGHVHAVSDYFLLIKRSITNKEFRHFVQLNSSDTATKLLWRMNLPSIGKTKGKIYYPVGYAPP